ncbi:MAG: hypothetical protein HOF11_16780 [Rhodospirillaceae bacterium]|jgi:hypothetical protein|nr:hypothetical protein [Rhodospirillaceae bacterium]
MMRKIVGLAAMVAVGIWAVSAAGQNSNANSDGGARPKAPVLIPVTNSAKDIEISLAKLLKQRLKLESSLKLVNDDPENLRLHISIAADKKQGIPPVFSVIDTAVVARDENGNAISQTISIAAAANLSFTRDQMPKLLQWANAWNARMIPIRVFIADNRVYTSIYVLGTTSEPASADRVVGSFLGVVRAWPAVMRDLQVNNFLAGKTK